ncbi:hypothetical protein MORE_25610 [Moorella thermoacetica]|nr:hypothetical protein MORE_25610 [Moorella thermoacetica]
MVPLQRKNVMLFSILLWILGIIGIAINYSNIGFSLLLFWIAIFLIILAAMNVFRNINTTCKRDIALFLFLFGSSFYLLKFFRSPHFFTYHDELLHIQLLTKIITENSLDVKLTWHPLAADYPGLHLLTAATQIVGGLSSFYAGILVVGIIYSLILVYLFLIIREVGLSVRVAFLSSILFLGNANFYYYDACFTYQSIGLLLFALCLYLNIVSRSDRKIYFSILSIIAIFALTISHHLSSYFYVIIFMIIFLFDSKFVKDMFVKDKIGVEQSTQVFKSISINSAMIPVVIILIWVIYGAIESIQYYDKNILLAIKSILNFSIADVFAGNPQRLPGARMGLSQLELLMDKFIFPPLVLVLFIVSFFIIKKQGLINTKLFALLATGIIYFTTWPLLFIHQAAELAIRSWTFLFLGVVPGIGITLSWFFETHKIWLRTVSIVGAILVLAGGISIGSTISSRVPDVVFAAGPSSIRLDTYKSAEWVKSYIGSYRTFVSDWATGIVLACIGDQYYARDVSTDILLDDNLDKEYLYVLRKRKVDYIVYNKKILKYPSEYGYYARREELIEKTVSFFDQSTIPETSLEKFMVPFFIKVFSCGDIVIFLYL